MIHAAIVCGCGLVGVTVMCGTVLSYGIWSGTATFVWGTLLLLVVLFFVLLIGVSRGQSSRRYKWGLVVACFLPLALIWTTCFAVQEWHESQLPYDRFQDNLASPIPASVSDLRFVPLARTVDPNLTMRFKISKPDLDQIIRNKGYIEVEAGHFRNASDRFNDPRYLKTGNDDEFYQIQDKWGDEDTLRVNKAHTEAVYRNELFVVYK